MAGKSDIVEQALKLVMGGGEEAAKTGIKAYHVSPHDFDKFEWSPRTSKTGEGNQSYGAGLYFAENPSVSGRGGDYWRQFFNKMKSGPERTAAGAMFANKFELEKAIKALESGSKYHADRAIPGRYGDGPEIELGHKLLADESQQALDILRNGQIAGPRTYEVDINADPESFIDWDKPLHSQPSLIDRLSRSRSPNVQRVLSNPKLMAPYRESYGVDIGPMTGEDLFKGIALNQTGIPTGTPKTSSLFLQSEIPGIKYLDAGSRGAGDGTRNYVIFNDKLIDIKDKYANGGEVDPYIDSGAVVDPYADEIAVAKAANTAKHYADQPWSEWAGDVVGNALNTAKAILPTALGGEGKIGISDMARGAYESGKDAVTFPGDVITGKQPLYDERGQPLESAVGRSFNTAATLGGASSVVPVPENSLRVFGGIRSKTADKNALAQAQILESQAADRDAIWREAGWGRGAEGKWRYEMPDTETTVDPSKFNLDLSNPNIPSGMKTTLGEYINHPELFDAYPEFKNMVVKGYYDPYSNVNGYYMPRYNRGTINPGFSDPYIALNLSHLPTVEAQRSTLLHEIQHAIQQKEGFVPGTNVSSRPLQTANPLHAFYKEALRTEPELQELEALRATDAFKAEQAEKQALFAEFKKKIEELDAKEATTGVSTKQEYIDAVNNYMKETSGKFPLAIKAGRLGFKLEDRGIPASEPPEFLDQMGAYLADAGEVESRNVQNRKDAPREELKERPPWRTQDKGYPYEGQLIDWNNTAWRKGYAGRGRVIADVADEAVNLAKRLFSSEPAASENLANLAKERGVTPADIGKPFGGIAPSVPYDEWRFEYKPKGTMIPQKPFDPESLRPGDVMIPLIGDRTANGRLITSIAGKQLEKPVVTEGGPDYMRGPSQIMDRNVWASDQGAITKLNNRIENAMSASRAAGYKDPNAYGVYVAMGPDAGDFSTHTAEALMGMMPHAKILKKDVAEFDKMMKAQDENWPGLMKPGVADYVVNADAGAHRKAFVQAMDSAYWRNKGFPDASLARYATTTPDLVTAPTEAAGYGVAKLNPGVPYGPITAPHRTYTTPMPGEYAGTMPPGIMRDDVFTQHSARFDANPPATNLVMAKRRSFERNQQQAYQLMHEQDIQNLIDFINKVKNGYADGGEVDEDVNDALRIARAEGGRAGYATDGAVNPQVFLTDAQGRQYDAQGRPIAPAATQAQSNSAASPEGTENINKMFNVAPQNYQTDVQPLIDYAVTPIDRPGMASEPDLVDVMRVATQVAAEGQPTDDRGEGNLARRREEAINKFYGADPEQPNSPSSNQAWVTNRMVDFSPVALGEIAHDIPYEAGRTGDYGTAAVEGGINALLTAPVMGAVGRGLKKGYEYAKRFPLLPAAVAGAAGMTAGSDEAEAGPARWYSKLLEAAHALPMEKMTGEQALAMLRKGVSPEELRWTGTENLLTSTPRISKGELLDHISRNRLKVNEVMLGGDRPSDVRDVLVQDIPKEIRDKYMPNWLALNEQKMALSKALNEKMKEIQLRGIDRYSDPEYVNMRDKFEKTAKSMDDVSMAMRQEYVDSIGGLAKKPKYESYSTQGGKGYRENLYTLGTGAPPRVEQRNNMWSLVDENGNVMRGPHGGEYTYWSENDANRAAKSLYRDSGRYKSSHWDDPDVLFHTRSQTLTYDPPGANLPYTVHNVDETQSDWGQEGRKSGFKDYKAIAEVARLRQETQELQRKLKTESIRFHNEHVERIAPYVDARNRYESELRDKYRKGEISLGEMNRLAENYETPEAEFTGKYRAASYEILKPLQDQIAANEAEIERIGKNIGNTPVGPFVTSTEGWTDRAIKHELDKALDNNADYFSWTPGQAHADRYDLTKHIGKIEYNPDDGSFFAYDPSGKMVINESINDPSELDNYVGKELADKIRAEETSRRSAIDEYDISKNEETGKWEISLYGEPSYDGIGSPLDFDSKGEAKDYLNQMMADEFAQNPVRLKGLDLKTGGEGMLGYYDKVYFKRVQDVLKKATGEKPVIEEIEVQTADGPRKQLGIRLTDEMRQKARFSDFNRGGTVTGPHSYGNDDPAVSRAIALTREY